MKKALSLFISAILVLSLTIGAVSANAALGDKIDLSSLVSSLSNLSTSTSEARSDVNFVVAPARSGDVEKSVSGNTVTLTAKPNEGYKFVAWYKNLQDITDEKPYSTEATINVELISGTTQYFYALFESTETTPSVSITVPSISIPDITITKPDVTITKPDVNLPSNIIPTRATAPTASGSQVKTTTTTAVTADAARVERASQLMDNLNKTLSKANEPSTTKASSTSTTKAASKSKSKKPKKTSISKIKAQKKGFKVTWKKVSNAKGYQVKYSTSKKFTKKTSKTATVKKATTTSKTVKDLKKKKTYYVKVRSYKTVNGKKVYSDWSKVKKVKTK